MDQVTRDALDEALDDEYKARATYAAVIDRFGDVRPFVNILAAEGRHIDALLALYQYHGIEPPPDRWAGRIEAPASLEEACQAGVAKEQVNVAMYERLLDCVDQPEIRLVMSGLQEASRDRHLPAFERCLEPGPGAGRGPRAGRGRRRRGRGGTGEG